MIISSLTVTEENLLLEIPVKPVNMSWYPP